MTAARLHRLIRAYQHVRDHWLARDKQRTAEMLALVIKAGGVVTSSPTPRGHCVTFEAFPPDGFSISGADVGERLTRTVANGTRWEHTDLVAPYRADVGDVVLANERLRHVTIGRVERLRKALLEALPHADVAPADLAVLILHALEDAA